MRKIKADEFTVRRLMDLYFLSKHFFQMDNPEKILLEFAQQTVKEAVKRAQEIDGIDIEYSFLKYKDFYVSEFFDTSIPATYYPEYVSKNEVLESC